MKKEIHPDNYRPVVFQDKSGDFRFLTRSCAVTKDTIEWEDGKEYPLVNVEISSASHPFYTGKQKFVDAAGRLEKFGKKYNWEDSSKDQIEEAAKKRKKKAGKEKVGSLAIPTFKRKAGEEAEEGGGPRGKGGKPAAKGEHPLSLPQKHRPLKPPPRQPKSLLLKSRPPKKLQLKSRPLKSRPPKPASPSLLETGALHGHLLNWPAPQ